MWDEERLVREEAHAERRVALFAVGALNVAAHDPRAGDDPMKLPRETSRRKENCNKMTLTREQRLRIIRHVNAEQRLFSTCFEACVEAHWFKLHRNVCAHITPALQASPPDEKGETPPRTSSQTLNRSTQHAALFLGHETPLKLRPRWETHSFGNCLEKKLRW